jgi:hypothetical protein
MTDLQPPLDPEDVAVMRRMAGIAGWILVVLFSWAAVLMLIDQVGRQEVVWRGWGMVGYMLAIALYLVRSSRAK